MYIYFVVLNELKYGVKAHFFNEVVLGAATLGLGVNPTVIELAISTAGKEEGRVRQTDRQMDKLLLALLQASAKWCMHLRECQSRG